MSYSANQVFPGRSIWRDPIAIAAIASVGFHGLLWFALPHLKLNASPPREPDIQRKVGLIQLTPQEQSRLPQFNDVVPPATALPLPSGGLVPPPNSFSFSPLPPPSTGAFPPPSSFFIPLPETLPPRVNIEPTRRSPLPTRSTERQPQPAQPSPPPSDTLRRMQENGRFSDVLRGGTTQAQLQPSPSPTSTPSGQNQNNGATPSDRPTTSAADLTAERERIAALLAPTSEGAQDGNDAGVAYLQWFREVLGRSETDADQSFVEESIALRYPREVCALRQPAAVRYGVLVDKDGKISGDPKLLQSAGRGIFNERALEAVRNYAFNNRTGTDQIYVVNVTFEYNNTVCPAVVPPTAPPS